MPWMVIDYKGEDLINQIPHAKDLNLGSPIPDQPGIYRVHPRPKIDDDAVEALLWRIHEHGNTGVFVDEAFTMPDRAAYSSLLIQGRSKHIPMINCSQRPAWIPGPVFSESDMHSIFYLSDRRDQKRINEFARVDFDKLWPDDASLPSLPPYNSVVYRVKDRATFHLHPVPAASRLLETFARRLAPKRRVL